MSKPPLSAALSAPLSQLEQRDTFIARHIGPNRSEAATMLAATGAPTIDALIDQTVPPAIRLPTALPLGSAKPEHEALADLRAIARKNVVKKSFIGMGYYGTYTPAVILR